MQWSAAQKLIRKIKYFQFYFHLKMFMATFQWVDAAQKQETVNVSVDWGFFFICWETDALYPRTQGQPVLSAR